MVATEIGVPATDNIVVHDHATYGSGTYAWGVIGKFDAFEPLGALWSSNIVTDVVIKDKLFDMKALGKISGVIDGRATAFATEWDNFCDMRDTWESIDDWLYLTVRSAAGGATNLATKGTKAAPTVQNGWRGKLFNLRWSPEVKGTPFSVEFWVTTQ